MFKTDIEEFIFREKLPFDNRLFFLQHLVPYVFFKPTCGNQRVLEIGIGDGFGSYYLSKDASYVVGLDIDFSVRDNLKKYIDRYKVKNIFFLCADAVYLPFRDSSFDRVICSQVIEHIPEDGLLNFLQEIYRVLKTGGQGLICTLNIENSKKNPATYEKFPQHHKEFNRREFKGLLSKVFPGVELRGVDLSLRHRFFRRLKRWGFLKYDLCGCNPVRKFYERISCADFRVCSAPSKTSLDLIGLCTKTP